MAIKDLAKPALIVVDMQRYFLERGAGAYLAPPRTLIANTLRLIEAFRRAGLPVVFTRHAHPPRDPAGQMGRWWNGKLPREGDPESDLSPGLAPLPGELIITKRRYSTFEGTSLNGWLARRKVRTLVICGVMTNLCVETTARHAFMKDYQPVIAKDACAANTRRLHKASLANLAYGFAYVMPAREIVSMIGRNP